jgi:hypothetical protein
MQGKNSKKITKKYKSPKDVLKITIFLYRYGLVMAQAWALNQ